MKLARDRIGARGIIVGTRVSTVFSRLSFPWRGIGALVVGVLLARWTWILFAPNTLAVLPAKLETSGNSAELLFGVAAASGVSTVNTAAVLGTVHLLGVFSGKQGFAVFKIDEKNQRGVALGEDVSNGNKLVEVAADHVVLEHNGVRQQVNLEAKSASNNGVALEHPRSAPAVGNAVAGWNQARQEMQKKQELSKVHP